MSDSNLNEVGQPRPQWQWVSGVPVAAVALDLYEAVNLRSALEAIMEHSAGTALAALNSGDWVGQIRWKLPMHADLGEYHARMFPTRPNRTAESYREDALRIHRTIVGDVT